MISSKIQMTLLLITGLMLIIVGSMLATYSEGGQDSKPVPAEPPTIMYHKTVEVEVIDSGITWCNVKTHFYQGFIKVQNKEYGLEERIAIDNSSPYFEEVYFHQLVAGKKIKATLYSWKKGNEIVNRELGELER